MLDVTLVLGSKSGFAVPLAGAPRLALPRDVVKVSAGFPSPAADNEDNRLDINGYLVRNAVSTFFFSVQGDAMQGAEIFDGDVLVVDKSLEPQHGHIVVAFVDGERLAKRLYKRGARVALVAENPAYPSIEAGKDMKVVIWGVVVGIAFSSNYALYADMSGRVFEVLGQFSSHLEVYSIDESFLDLAGYARLREGGLAAYGREICQRIDQSLGLAACVGIGSTKTLAKLANHCAKKRLAGSDGVCDLTATGEQELASLLGRISVGEVWGVGRKIAPRLDEMGIHTVRDLRNADTKTIRARFSVVLERTVRELRGTTYLKLEEMAPAKQQIMSSRSFGQCVYDLRELKEAMASYIGKAAQKLRAQDSVAGAVQVLVRTNPFKLKEPQCRRAVTIALPEPRADTRALTKWAFQLVERVFRPGFAYHNAGVMLSELRAKRVVQDSLFATLADSERSVALMQTAEGMTRGWQTRRGSLSPAYTNRGPSYRW